MNKTFVCHGTFNVTSGGGGSHIIYQVWEFTTYTYPSPITFPSPSTDPHQSA